MTRSRALPMVALVIWVGACTTQPAATTEPVTTISPSTEVRWQTGEPLPDQLLGTQWQLIGGVVDGETLGPGASPDKPSHIGFYEQDSASGGTEIVFDGFLGCNGFSGFVTEGAGLSLGAVTVLDCTSAEHNHQRLLTAALVATDTMDLAGDTLTLTGPNTEIHFVPR